MSTPKKKQLADFELVIEKNKVDPSTFSKNIKNLIGDYNDVKKGADDILARKEADGKLSEEDQRDLDTFTDDLAIKDKELVGKINYYIANAERFKARGAEMQRKLQEKKNGGDKTPPPPPPPPPPPSVQLGSWTEVPTLP